MTVPVLLPLARAFRRATLPLAAYYTVTLVLPLANGAAFSDAFIEHALVVLLVPIVIILSTAAIGMVIRKTRLGRQAVKRSSVACSPHGRVNHEAALWGTKPTKHETQPVAEAS